MTVNRSESVRTTIFIKRDGYNRSGTEITFVGDRFDVAILYIPSYHMRVENVDVLCTLYETIGDAIKLIEERNETGE